MRLTPSLSFGIALPLVAASFPGHDAPGLHHRDSFKFDINTGADLQRDLASKSAPEVEFTTEGGTPQSHPYVYQRIGSDGMLAPQAGTGARLPMHAGPLLLQDTYLTELFGHFDRERIPERVVHAKGGTPRLQETLSSQ